MEQEEVLILVKKAQNGDEIAKEKLIEANSPLIKSVIKWFKNKGVEYDDLYQLGCLGFLKAIKNFNCDFNVKFSTYVVPMVIGEIKRFMRDDGAIKVSRAIKSFNLQINKFIDLYLSKFGRKPTILEISNEFGIDEQEVVLTMDASKMPVSLYAPFEEDNDSSLSIIDKFESQEDEDFIDRIALKDIVNSLNERDRKIIMLRYYLDKTQSEIANELGVSQVQVSRLENKILENLKKKLM